MDTLGRTFFRKAFAIFTMTLMLFITVGPHATACTAPYHCEQYTTFPDIKLPHYVWKGSGKPKSIIVGIHGGCLHGRSFASFAHAMVARGSMFVSFDMRGYGRWYFEDYGTKDDRTFDYTQSIADAKGLIQTMRKKYPGVPVYCIGESLGANVSAIIAHESPQLVEGIVMVNPFGRPKFFLSPKMVMTAAEIAIKPIGRTDLSPYLEDRLSENEAWGEYQVEDPLARNKQSVKELGQSLAINLRGKKEVNEILNKVPIMVMIGGKDAMCSPKANAKLFAKIPNANKRMVQFPTLGHLIVEAPQTHKEVADSVGTWMRRQQQVASAVKKQTNRSRISRVRVIRG